MLHKILSLFDNFGNIWKISKCEEFFFFYCLSYWCWGIQVSKCFPYVTYCHKILQIWKRRKMEVVLLSIFVFGIFCVLALRMPFSKDMNWHLSCLCAKQIKTYREQKSKSFFVNNMKSTHGCALIIDYFLTTRFCVKLKNGR